VSEPWVLVGLIVVVLALGAVKVVWPDAEPVAALTVPVMIGGWRLSRRSVLILGVAVGAVLVVELGSSQFGRSYVAAGIVVLTWLLALRFAGMREDWGLGIRRGMGILFDLRDRVRAAGEPPAMARGWTMARSLRSAGDAAFRGDFTLALRDGSLVQALLVDVSGHGVDVAARSVQVAGAFGGLIGVVEPERTLSACNSYVERQDWDHDYATAVHVVVDEATAALTVRCAGHPPPRIRRADGCWEPLDARGPVLGLSPTATFAATSTTLDEGDALVLVSDGCLDEMSPDPWHAVTSTVERWLASGSPAGTQVLDVDTASGDDQTLLLIARTAERRG
jgi:hypothetical protein